jgi:hypothetical protein
VGEEGVELGVEDGLSSVVGVPAGSVVGVDVAGAEDELDGAPVVEGEAPPPPAAWAVQPVASATAAAAMSALRMTDERCIGRPPGIRLCTY